MAREGSSETTRLSAQDESKFQSWVKANSITDVDHPQSRYDYRGYWKDVASKGIDQRKAYEDGLHFPDTYKQHGHPTFSVESKYSTGPTDGGRWEGETFVPQTTGQREPKIGPVALGDADYAQLYEMFRSEDAAERADALALSKKLTPAEHRDFFDFQQRRHAGAERHRVDNSVLGVPPELVATGIVGVGRSMVSAGVGAAKKAVAAAKALASETAPVIKYEVTRSGLEAIGLPPSLAIPAAIAVSGYRKGQKPAARPKVKAVLSDLELAKQEVAAGRLPQSVVTALEQRAAKTAQAAPVATNAAPAMPQASPAPSVAPAVSQAPKISPKELNAVTLAGRRAKTPLTVPEQFAAAGLVQKGQSAEQAVASVVQARGGSAAERLRASLGTPDDEAVKAQFQKAYERGSKTAPHQ